MTLAPRERQVADLALEGLSNKEIARRLGLSHETVKACLASVYRKCGVTGRHDLLAQRRDTQPSP